MKITRQQIPCLPPEQFNRLRWMPTSGPTVKSAPSLSFLFPSKESSGCCSQRGSPFAHASAPLRIHRCCRYILITRWISNSLEISSIPFAERELQAVILLLFILSCCHRANRFVVTATLYERFNTEGSFYPERKLLFCFRCDY